MIIKPDFSHGWLDIYIAKIEEPDLLIAMELQSKNTLGFYYELPAAAWEFAYAPGKWTIKELLLHLIDCERIFVYRALMFARGEENPLPGFDEDGMVANSLASERDVQSLLDECSAVRNSTISFFKNLNHEAALKVGTANNTPMCAAGLGFSTLGHELHHLDIIGERYLSQLPH